MKTLTRYHVAGLLALVIAGSNGSAIAKSYKGAELRTKASFTYGRFEVRMKSLQKSGALSSFFTYNDSYPSTPWNEIDIEIMGRYEHDIQFNPITPGQVNHVAHHYTSFNPALDFHVYAFEWTPTYVAWFVDGVEVHRQTGAHIESLTQPQKIMMNVWNPTAVGWAGPFDPKTLPAFAFYDWVSYASHTPGAGSVGTGNNFTFQWKDEFDTYDTNRWAKGTHTWDGNGCDFVEANAVFSGGNLILCLTDDVNLGYQDKLAPSMLYAWGNGSNVIVRFTEELDSTSAVNAANYFVSGCTLQSVQLREDRRTIDCVLSGVDPGLSYSFFVMSGVKDRAGNTVVTHQKPIRKSALTAFPIKINVGGPAWGSYLADQEWNDGLDYGYEDGTAASAPGATITGTTEPEIYRTERYLLTQYNVRVPNGSYVVRVMMCENYFTTAGARRFTVMAEGQQLVRDLDLYATAGKGAALVRLAQPVVVTDGVLNIHFGASVNNPLVNGIVIEQITTDVGHGESSLPTDFHASQNYPNPFNGQTMFRCELPERSGLTFRVFDSLGRQVDKRDLGEFPAGTHSFSWNAADASGAALASGVFIYSVESAFGRSSGTMMHLK